VAYEFEVSDRVPAPPDVVYSAWLSSEEHSAMTGGAAHVDAREGGDYDACDGYINGVILRLEPFSRIVQTWRTEHFTEEHLDSQIEVMFLGDEDETLVIVRHTNVPEDQLDYENGGWQTKYFDPMKSYFASSNAAS